MGSEIMINFELTMLIIIIWTSKVCFSEEVDSAIVSGNQVFSDRHNKVTTYVVFKVWVFSCQVSFQKKYVTLLSTAAKEQKSPQSTSSKSLIMMKYLTLI